MGTATDSFCQGPTDSYLQSPTDSRDCGGCIGHPGPFGGCCYPGRLGTQGQNIPSECHSDFAETWCPSGGWRPGVPCSKENCPPVDDGECCFTLSSINALFCVQTNYASCRDTYAGTFREGHECFTGSARDPITNEPSYFSSCNGTIILCCRPNAASPGDRCLHVTPDACASDSGLGPGTSYGAGVRCADANFCSGDVGACCLPTGECATRNQFDCTALAGHWLGLGTTCKNEGQTCRGSCCWNRCDCRDGLFFSQCIGPGAVWKGRETTCDRIDCTR